MNAQGTSSTTRAGGRATPNLVVAAALRLEALALRRRIRSASIVRTGMGPANARRAARALMTRPEPTLAVAGLSGALGPGLTPGDVVVVSALCEPDGDDPGYWNLATAEGMRAVLARAGLSTTLGRLATVDHLVRGPERAELRKSGADIVDMESAHLVRAAAGRPVAVVRVVVDTPSHELASPSMFRNGARALRALAAIGPALESWADACVSESRSDSEGSSAEPACHNAAARRSTRRSA